MRKHSRLIAALLSLIFCLSFLSFSAYAVGDDEGSMEIVVDEDSDDNDSSGQEEQSSEEETPEPDDSSQAEEPEEQSSEQEEDSQSDAESSNDSDSGSDEEDSQSSADSDNSDDSSSDSSEEDDDNGYDDDSGYDNDSSNDGESSESYNDGSDDDESVYYDSDGNDYSNYSDVYVGGGQSYEPPQSTAPSAPLYQSGGIDVKELSKGDWGDIAAKLNNSGNVADDGIEDFSFIQKNNGAGDNGHWIIIGGILLILLSLAGFTYLIVSKIMMRKKLNVGYTPSSKSAAPAAAAEPSEVTVSASREHGGRDDYDDGFKASSKKTSKHGKRYK